MGDLPVRTPCPAWKLAKQNVPPNSGGKSKRGVGAMWVVKTHKKQTQKHHDSDELVYTKTRGASLLFSQRFEKVTVRRLFVR